MGLLFESVGCSRCGGTGMFGPLSVEGGRCFKCSGQKEVLTKRGHAAQVYYNGLTTKAVADVQVGDVIECHIVTISGQLARTYRTVAAIGERVQHTGMWRSTVGNVTTERPMPDTIYFTDTKGDRWGHDVDATIRFRPTGEQRKELQAQALAYQETLTASGTVRKTAARAPKV